MEQQKENEKSDQKPVGYGSTIQSSGYGNRDRPPQPIDQKIPITNEDQKIEEEKEKETNE